MSQPSPSRAGFFEVTAQESQARLPSSSPKPRVSVPIRWPVNSLLRGPHRYGAHGVTPADLPWVSAHTTTGPIAAAILLKPRSVG